MKHSCCILLLVTVIGVCQVTPATGQSKSARPYVVNKPPTLLELDRITWNDVADFLLKVLRSEAVKRHKEVLPIPDISKDFSTKVEFLNVSGHISADHGWFRNLTSVRRTEDAIVVHTGNNYTVTLAIGLDVIEVGYDHYQVTISGIKLNGHISGNVGANSIRIKLAADLDKGHCSAKLQELKVVQLDDMTLTLTGFGVLNDLVEEIANKEIADKKQVIVDTIEQNLREQVEAALETIHC